MKLRLLLMFFSFGAVSFVAAQKGSLSGMLTDSSGKSPVPFATITVFQANDTSIVSYRLSDPEGKFKVPALPVQIPLRAVITASGLEVIRREFVLTNDSSQIDWGLLKMMPDLKELEEVLVVAERPPVVYRNDTIEFNANAFKTLPSALVEDMLKKFPGVDVDRDGNITVNGRKANRLLVDSKEFFGSDPKMATRNLPANIIDKVQISDDLEQKDRDPNINPADLGVVINLKLKKSIKKGWFGKVYAGAGSNDRYETGGIINTFRDTLQVSLLGYTNNLNRSAFSIDDVMNLGGFNRNSINSVMISSDGGFALNDISFGGMSEGITRSTAFGVNGNTMFGKNVQLSMQYFYGNNGTDLDSRSNQQQFFGDTVQTTTASNNTHSVTQSHRFSSYLNWKIDSLSRLTWRPAMQWNDVNARTNSQSVNGTNFDPLLNDGVRYYSADQSGISLSQELAFTRNSARNKGRSFFASLTNRYSRQTEDQINQSENNFYKISSSTSLDQFRDLLKGNSSHRLYIRYNEPLSKRTTLQLTESLEVFDEKDEVDTYDFDPVSQQYTIINNDQTNGVQRRGVRSTANLSAIVREKSWSIQPGIAIRNLHIRNEFQTADDVRQDYFYITPSLSIRKGIYNFTYSVNLNEPQATDLQPASNNSNPLYRVLGNPNLRPGLGHGVYLSAFKFNPTKGQSFNVYLNGTINNNAIVRARTIDENGVQTTRPVNADGVWSLQSSVSYRREHKYSSTFKLNYSASTFLNFQRQLLLLNGDRSQSNIWSLGPTLSLGLNWKDKIEWTQRYNPTWNQSRYEDPTFPSLSVWRHRLQSDLVLRMPKRIVWENNITYVHNPQVAPGIRKSIVTWNAGVNFLFLKEDRAQLKLFVYDLLNQTTSVNRTVRENYIQDMQTTVLQRYVMLTFSYNIRNFSAGKVGGGNRLFIF